MITAGFVPVLLAISLRISRAERSGSCGSNATCRNPILD